VVISCVRALNAKHLSGICAGAAIYKVHIVRVIGQGEKRKQYNNCPSNHNIFLEKGNKGVRHASCTCATTLVSRRRLLPCDNAADDWLERTVICY
jgi:hypothetical protein